MNIADIEIGYLEEPTVPDSFKLLAVVKSEAYPNARVLRHIVSGVMASLDYHYCDLVARHADTKLDYDWIK